MRDLPAAAELLRRTTETGVVVLGTARDPAPPQRVHAVLLAGRRVGAVVAVGGSGTAAPAGDGGGGARRDVADTALGAVAVAPGALRDLRLDPRVTDPVTIARAVVAHVRAAGLRVLADPQWVVDGPAGAAVAAGAPAEAGPPSEILVISGFLSDAAAQVEDLLVFDLIRSLTEQAVDASISLLLTDGSGSGHQAERLRANGVEVAMPPLDQDAWLGERLGRFSHTIVTPSALQSPIWTRLRATQPQSARLLYLSGLPFREVSALAPLTPPLEQASLESVRAAVEARTFSIAADVDAVWCNADADARWVRGVLPGVPTFVVGPVMDRCRAPVPLAERSGIMILGDLGHDVIKANEDAAVAAMQQILPALRRRLPDLPAVVIADRPTPFLAEAAASAGARVLPGLMAQDVAAHARLIVDLHTYGTGGEAALRLALAAGTPFVAHPVAAGGLELGPLGGQSLFGATTDLVFLAAGLLQDDERWERFHSLIGEVVATSYPADQRAIVLREALASAGIEARMPAGRWIEDGSGKDRRAPHRPVRLPLRPGTTPVPPALPGSLPDDHDGRYRLWAERYGPTDGVLAAIGRELATLAYRPVISVLVPVYNTPGDVLRATVDSVRNQLYDGWQLCLADDGSTLPETLEVLRSLAGDPRVRQVRLGGNSGISGATNAALELADGEYVAFLDHDDLYKPHALAQVVRWLNADPSLDLVYSDEDKIDEDGRLVQPHLKPDWSPNMIMSQNYVCHLTVLRRSLLAELGGLRSDFDGSQDHDLILRVTECTDRIAHIPEPLYSWRIMAGSASADINAKPYALDAARRALRDALVRRGHPGSVVDSPLGGMYRTRYHLFGQPRVSIVVPTKNGLHLLEPCLRSVFEKSTYRNFEVVVIDNQTTDGPTLQYLATFPGTVLRYNHPFNYARMMNAAARAVDCDALLFLNNDTEVITPEWIEGLLEHAMRPQVGAVGGRLYYTDGRVQHEGTVVGLGGWANNIDHAGYWGRGEIVRDVSAVMGACTMMRSSVYWRIGGNEERLRVAYNDVDLCLRAHQAGFDVVYTPDVELYHHEGASRSGREHHEDGPQFGIRWRPTEQTDPYYSPLFEPTMPPFRIRL